MRTPLLSADAVQQRLQTLHGWTLNSSPTPQTLTRTFNFTAAAQSPFLQGLEFIKQVAALAESIDHHPDIFYTYNKVMLTLTTHDSHGLTEKDFELAALISSIG
ncbi:MAG: 4a-hydroxytetrahydrobiopterin dehydratase [Rhizobacter sp.]|nr:4a-hydroxytetrahydrobiopterin dehydratase [Chlorobiales bacterium]